MSNVGRHRNLSGRIQFLVVLCLGLFFGFVAAYNTFRWDFVLFGVVLELVIIPAILAVLSLPFLHLYLLLVDPGDDRKWYLLALFFDLLIVAGLAWATLGKPT